VARAPTPEMRQWVFTCEKDQGLGDVLALAAVFSPLFELDREEYTPKLASCEADPSWTEQAGAD